MFGLAPKYLGWLGQGFLLTLGLAAASAVAAAIGGLLLAVLRHARVVPLRAAAAAYVVAFRNTPLLVQLLFWYFGVASLLPETWTAWLNAGHVWRVGPLALAWPSFEFVAGWVGLSAYTAAFVAEECEAGLRGVRRAQHDAAAALGLTPLQSLRYVVLPQAVRIALPPLFGQIMNLVKNSSLAMAIGVAELSYASRQVETETFKTFAAFGIATLLYVATVAAIEAGAYATTQWRDRLGTGR
ncbi:amino acid ABC transporter permease [Burkholderia multivorans]|jgi:polar amino acid transport system permease protein|uniref:amino acid ABC transporter permease n=1 Tax=Burkholderia multivorans TaxID=87883 RepID=UPI00057F2BC2|nr:amino acid ABC transporter permease [Burkholderia multivorans]KHS14239.1 amino acid ABC transporter permease [Burkholderia multivorans]KHS17323.1 amino acid ABC transporter permease [Burkholderia multivorans]MBR7922357.1 amino acid ABC transporter permease [Burkholderia multivorans]MBR8105441.1 amino acid ABC transporter permease [Burkholderia multivorans]MBR8337314.1 amino acid ABC transporter permease [Burkholderia multivorans]